jgi:hypothetical protein
LVVVARGVMPFVQFTSRNLLTVDPSFQFFDFKIVFVAVATPVNLKAWPSSPSLLGMMVLF